jgi:UDP-N-acetylglucosamine 2-epimerase (non-hydrolysing)
VSLRVVAVVGTRPEVIKMAPLVRELASRSPRIEVALLAVAQQPELVARALAEWDLAPAWQLDLPAAARTPAAVLGGAVSALTERLEALSPDVVAVQGDTTTALAGALAGAYARCPVAHVEAGLRSFCVGSPFPEELHRALVDRVADVLYAPTLGARDNLLAEGVAEARIRVVGNTVVDALAAVSGLCPPVDAAPGRKVVLVTGHRRETSGAVREALCRSLGALVAGRPDVELVYVLHSHPAASDPVRRLLSDCARVRLLPPLSYRAFVAWMRRADVVLTDSGGVQEEAPALGRPVLVTRDRSERLEAVTCGVARLVGSDPAAVCEALARLLDDDLQRRAMARVCFPFGEPGAAVRIADDLQVRFGGGP